MGIAGQMGKRARASLARSRRRSLRTAKGGRRCTPATSSSARIGAPSRRAGSGSRTGCTPRSPSTRSTPSRSSMPSSRSTRRTPAYSFSLPRSASECRLLNGYVYSSANLVTDDATLARRAELFARRGGHYYEHWDELYERWLDKVEAATSELIELQVPEMGELEDESIVTEGRGLGSSYALLQAYDRLIEGVDRIFQYHFEFLALGYGAYLLFYERCREAFPDISDQTIARMVSAIDVLVLRPDDELRRLARLAVELGVSEQVASAENEEELAAALMGSDAGERWLADFEQTKDPWFYFSCGTGVFHHHHRSWIDDTRFPIQTIGSYIARLDAGEDISRPAKRSSPSASGSPRSTARCSGRSCARPSTRASRSPARCSPTSRTTTSTSTTATSRSSGTRCARSVRSWRATGSSRTERTSSSSATTRYGRHWKSCGSSGVRVAQGWRAARACGRRSCSGEERSTTAMRAWAPPPALGQLLEKMTDPFTIMLWGVTDERVQEWLSSDGGGTETLTGCPASPGVAEGLARVLLRVDQLGELEDGEILVAPVTSPSWTPVFHRIAAAVLDTGGIMCHAAIVAREYGLPAVVGTGTGDQDASRQAIGCTSTPTRAS